MLCEPKWDGFRVVIVRDDEVTLWSRRGMELLAGFPELQAAAAAVPPGCIIIDGEAVVWGSGRLDLDALQCRLGVRKERAAQLAHAEPASFVEFDVLAVAQPLSRRRALLEPCGPTSCARGPTRISGSGPARPEPRMRPDFSRAHRLALASEGRDIRFRSAGSPVAGEQEHHYNHTPDDHQNRHQSDERVCDRDHHVAGRLGGTGRGDSRVTPRRSIPPTVHGAVIWVPIPASILIHSG